jgi:cytochrome c oxidase subunit 2
MTISTMQYAFIPSPASVPAGPVRIEVSSVDVNHGVGIYSPDGVLIAQVQAMPGKTNILETELDEPGAYQLLCMEYCGLAHHQMRGVITVTDAATKDRKS